jgi:monoamine oxidase
MDHPSNQFIVKKLVLSGRFWAILMSFARTLPRGGSNMAVGIPNENAPIDYAIVGAGVTGLYCAWRLLTATQKPQSIYVFERDARVGGRLLSLNLLDRGRKAELGGMRFTDRQVLVNETRRNLAKELDDERARELKRDPFEFPIKMMYLRGRQLHGNDKAWLKKSSYSLKCKEPNLSKSAIAVATYGIRRALDFLDSSSAKSKESIQKLRNHLNRDAINLQEWRDLQENVTIKTIDRKLYEVGFWNLLHRFLPTSDFLFLHDALGYESLLANSNAAQTIPNFLADFDNPSYFTLAGGMESLPRSLEHRCKNAGCRIAMQCEVKSIRLVPLPSGGKEFTLDVTCNSNAGHDASSFGSGAYQARNVILALPKEALKKIHLDDFGKEETSHFRQGLEGVTAHPAFKLFLMYECPWT